MLLPYYRIEVCSFPPSLLRIYNTALCCLYSVISCHILHHILYTSFVASHELRQHQFTHSPSSSVLDHPIPPGHPYHVKTNLIWWSSGQQSQSHILSLAPSTTARPPVLVLKYRSRQFPPRGLLPRREERERRTKRQVQQPPQPFRTCKGKESVTAPHQHLIHANPTTTPLTPFPV